MANGTIYNTVKSMLVHTKDEKRTDSMTWVQSSTCQMWQWWNGKEAWSPTTETVEHVWSWGQNKSSLDKKSVTRQSQTDLPSPTTPCKKTTWSTGLVQQW